MDEWTHQPETLQSLIPVGFPESPAVFSENGAAESLLSQKGWRLYGGAVFSQGPTHTPTPSQSHKVDLGDILLGWLVVGLGWRTEASGLAWSQFLHL